MRSFLLQQIQATVAGRSTIDTAEIVFKKLMKKRKVDQIFAAMMSHDNGSKCRPKVAAFGNHQRHSKVTLRVRIIFFSHLYHTYLKIETQGIRVPRYRQRCVSQGRPRSTEATRVTQTIRTCSSIAYRPAQAQK